MDRTECGKSLKSCPVTEDLATSCPRTASSTASTGASSATVVAALSWSTASRCSRARGPSRATRGGR
eukprot:2828983-Prymnesium_polylepis.1